LNQEKDLLENSCYLLYGLGRSFSGREWVVIHIEWNGWACCFVTYTHAIVWNWDWIGLYVRMHVAVLQSLIFWWERDEKGKKVVGCNTAMDT